MLEEKIDRLSMTTKVIISIVTHGLYGILIYFALFVGAVWAINLYIFLIYLFVILTVVGAFGREGRFKVRHSTGDFIKALNLIVTFIEMCLLAAFGWFWYAILITIQFIAYVIVYFGKD